MYDSPIVDHGIESIEVWSYFQESIVYDAHLTISTAQAA